jgi:hypothetical protein
MKGLWLLVLAAPVSWLVGSAPARADEPEPPGCPPGEWFCDDAAAEQAPPEAFPAEPDVPAEAAPEGASPGEVETRAEPAPPPELPWSEGSGPHGISPWGLALRVEGVLLESGNRGDVRLGGVGISGRYTLNPVVTLDLGLDAIVGTDYSGYDRSELSLSMSSLFFLNQHPVVRTYVLAGLNTSTARVEVVGEGQTWWYLGLQGGLGLELTLGSRLALNVDILAFMRGRTDSRAAREPEFIDASGRVTNTSGGGLLRGGVSLRF